jgi:hypothetical protein
MFGSEMTSFMISSRRFLGHRKGSEMSRKWRLSAYEANEKIEFENQGSFDELVVGDWLHVEQMDDKVWWLRLGDARVFVTLRGGEEPRVDVERGFYGPANGITKVP